MLKVVRILVLAFLLLMLGGKSNYAAIAVATDCTLYAAANGNDSNNGLTPSTPKTLSGANDLVGPATVLCLEGGTYNMTERLFLNGGSSSAWAVYKAYGDSPANLVFTGAFDWQMFNIYAATQWAGPSYVEVRGLNFDGQNKVEFAIFAESTHHVRAIGNTIKNTLKGGFCSIYSDYLTADGNKITHTGYGTGYPAVEMSSGISYNQNKFFDTYTGFHSYVVNNIISGSADLSGHTEGKGVIMDLSGGGGSNTPPVLIANNVMYENSANCVQVYFVSDIYVINNTCYKNSLDSTVWIPGEMEITDSNRSYWVNNIAYALSNAQNEFALVENNSGLVFRKNMFFNGAGLNFTPPDPAQFIRANPLFVNPLATSAGQYGSALDPASLGNALMLQAGSPAIDQGIDPTTIPGLNANIIAGLRQYGMSDINGNARPQGNGFDIGAYEYTSADTVPQPPTGLRILSVQ
jgi:hypothetical protein